MAASRARFVAAAAAAVVVTLAGCTGASPSTPASTSGATQGAQASPASQAPVTPRATSTPLWPAPADAMKLAIEAGLVPETSESLQFHVHAHLDIFLDGEPILVPAGIGINIVDPNVIAFTEPDGSMSYGGIQSPCAEVCISPLHTHASFGILHTESATPTPNTLGQFFVEWDVELSRTCVGEHCVHDKAIAIYVNGEAYSGDPADIELADRTQIAIVIGTPPADIPSTADFSQL